MFDIRNVKKVRYQLSVCVNMASDGQVEEDYDRPGEEAKVKKEKLVMHRTALVK